MNPAPAPSNPPGFSPSGAVGGSFSASAIAGTEAVAQPARRSDLPAYVRDRDGFGFFILAIPAIFVLWAVIAAFFIW